MKEKEVIQRVLQAVCMKVAAGLCARDRTQEGARGVVPEGGHGGVGAEGVKVRKMRAQADRENAIAQGKRMG